jgi:outer membrane lipoprotein carrier protein
MKLPLLAALMLVFISTAHAGVLEDIKERQSGVNTVRAGFSQEKHTELLERPIKSSGKFYFKSPVGVRWEYGDEMLVVYDGKTLYLHYTELEEAEKVEGVAGYAGPLVFDLGVILNDYDVDVEESGDAARLLLTPKKPMPFKSMAMTFPKGAAFPSQVSIFEESGDYTVIDFHGIRTNVPLSDGLFRFSPPPGVVVRERKLQ